MFTEKQMDKEDALYKHTHTHTHTHNGMLHSHSKHETLPSATPWMGWEGVMLDETSDRDSIA